MVTAGGGNANFDNGGTGGSISGLYDAGSNGGNGANRVGKDTRGGGGGGSGPAAANASGQTGGAPGGGNGGNINQDGFNGTSPGGGGGGKGDGSTNSYQSGNGANGQVKITWIVSSAPTITGTTPNSRCGTGTVVLGATTSAGTINWYAALTGGSSLGTGPSFTTPSISTTTTYYVDATNGGCTTATRTAVIATVNLIPNSPTVGTITQPTCTTATGSVVLNGLPEYWKLTRSPGNVTTIGAGTSTTISNLAPGTYTYTVIGTGLKGEYFNSTSPITNANNPTFPTTSPTLTRTDATVNFDWGNVNPGAPIGNDYFFVRWSGQIQPLYSQNYTFTTRSDDGIRLWVNGSLIINNWTIHAATDNTGSINLVAGVKYDIVLEYYENAGQAVAQLSWNSASQGLEIIPQSQLYSGTSCSSLASANVVINAQPATPTITGTTPSSRCGTGTVALSVTASAGTINWYASATGGPSLGTGTTYNTPPISNSTTYYVNATNGGCTTATRTAVTATVTATPVITPTTTGALICIGATATLSASGAVATERYLWYNAATGGTLLKTSTNNTDNIYTTTVLAATTNYWVSILNAGGCESARTIVNATFPANSPDSQTTAGTNTWIGHVYDGINFGVAYNGNFTNYYGTITEPETFDESFGGDYNCLNITSSLGNRSIYTETFSVRYRMNSTRRGLYVVDLGSDDGSRLTVDGALIYNNWSDQGWISRPRVLMSLTGSSTLLYDFYENGGGNRVNFNNLIPILSNTLSTNTSQNICPGKLGDAISGDTYGTLPTGISLSGSGYQWTYSTTLGGVRTNITGATGATYTPNAALVPFNNNPGTYYLFRNASVRSTNNIGVSPYVATNESNVATIVINGVNTWNGSVSTDWNTASNWCVGVPTIGFPNTLDVVIPLGLTNYPIIASGAAPGYVNTIVLENNTTLNVSENSLSVINDLTLNGNSKIDFEGESQLIQSTGSTFSGTGTIEIDQQGTGNSFRYNYWSSPVNSRGTTFTIDEVLRDGNGTGTLTNKNISFGGSLNWAGGVATSPIKLSTYWMYVLRNSGAGYNAWYRVGNTGEIAVGEGYTMKGSNTIAAEQNYTFVGTPNNGDIALPLTAGFDYLVGNPYPSAIDADQFLYDNGPLLLDGSASGTASFTGEIYFWEHYGGDTHNLVGYQAGYATYNYSGGAPASAFPGLGGGSSAKGAPGRYIPVGQAFFVVGDANGGHIQFKNGQRIFVKESELDVNGDSISVFMKSNKAKSKTVNTRLTDLRPKFRIGFDAPKISHRQLLLTIDERATQAVDWGFDAEIYEVFADDMYWMLNNKKYVIQGTNHVALNSEVPLGIQLSKTGLVTVKIDALENVDDDTAVYLKDKVTGESFNMREKPVQLNLTAGKYADRFVIVFKTQKLVAEDVVAEVLIPATAQPIIEGIHVFMNNAIGELQIKNNSTEEILSVALINSLGQTVKTWNSNFNIRTISLPISTATGIYIVQINTQKGATNKKIVVD